MIRPFVDLTLTSNAIVCGKEKLMRVEPKPLNIFPQTTKRNNTFDFEVLGKGYSSIKDNE